MLSDHNIIKNILKTLKKKHFVWDRSKKLQNYWVFVLFLAFYGKKTFFKIFQNWSKLFFSTNFMTHYMFKLLKTQKYAWKMVVYVISELWKTPPLSHPASHIWDAPCWTNNTTLTSKYFKIIVWYVLWD